MQGSLFQGQVPTRPSPNHVQRKDATKDCSAEPGDYYIPFSMIKRQVLTKAVEHLRSFQQAGWNHKILLKR